MSIRNIVLIGAGNLATQLGKALRRKGKNILQVISRTPHAAGRLAQLTGSEAATDLDRINPNADLYIVAFSDDAIVEMARTVNLHDKLVVHTSGSVPMDVMKNISSRYGVFYPLQTFSKARDVDFSDIPLCIEASDDESFDELSAFAREISNDVRKINSGQRQAIHLAAVFASNFTNYMYHCAEEILKKENIPFDIIRPLIRETANKVEHHPPVATQTGPALRNDMRIIEKHLQLLKNDPEKKELYAIISNLIARNNPKNF
jgi:predicted short-subunit dehydrogenase-like oxidoreductase (DUF2520 family)